MCQGEIGKIPPSRPRENWHFFILAFSSFPPKNWALSSLSKLFFLIGHE